MFGADWGSNAAPIHILCSCFHRLLLLLHCEVSLYRLTRRGKQPVHPIRVIQTEKKNDLPSSPARVGRTWVSLHFDGGSRCTAEIYQRGQRRVRCPPSNTITGRLAAEARLLSWILRRIEGVAGWRFRHSCARDHSGSTSASDLTG